MNFKSLADMAKNAIEQRGGTERLKQDAARLKDIATGPGTPQEKAKRASDALKQPTGDISGRTSSPIGDTAGVPVRPMDDASSTTDRPFGDSSTRP